MKNKLTPIESKILTVLIKHGDYMTTAEIAKKAIVSWNTALTYLNRFYDEGWVDKIGERTIYWIALISD